jgi:hypothetical protein
MRLMLTLVLAFAVYVAGAIAPSASADPYYCDGLTPFLLVEDAAACGSAGGLLLRYSHPGGDHYDCLYYDAYNHYSWIVHYC